MMTNEIPNALRLAKWLDAMPSSGYALTNQAAAELRRLHQSEREGWRYADELEQERRRLHALNAEMMEALREIVEFWDSIVPTECINEMHIKARAAIAKATGEQA